jgi:carbon storage regulator
MLVLTRKTQQTIQFGSDIVITILQVKGQSVRVGIEAPRGVRVVRGEIASKPAHVRSPDLQTAASVENQNSTEDIAVTTGRSATQPEFVRPAAGAPRMRAVGESSGLFPRLRQRASNSLTTETTSPRSAGSALLSLRSLSGGRV